MDRIDLASLRENAREFAGNVRGYKDDAKERAELLLEKFKLQNYLEEKKQDDKLKKIILTVLAIIGIVAAVAAIAYAVYQFIAPDYLEDYDDYDDGDDDLITED